MANFFSNLFRGFAGQQETPQYAPVLQASDLYRGARAALPDMEALNNDWQRYYTGLARDTRDQAFPGINALQDATTRRISDELGMGGELPPEIRDQIIRATAGTGALSGFGLSNGGRALTARDLGLTSYDIGQQRLNRAQQYTGQIPLGQNLMAPGLNTPVDTENIMEANQNLDRAGRNQASAIRSQNNINAAGTVTRTIGQIIGAIVGGMTGGTTGALGSIAGSMGGGGGGGGGNGLFNASLYGYGGGGGYGGQSNQMLGNLFSQYPGTRDRYMNDYYNQWSNSVPAQPARI